MGEERMLRAALAYAEMGWAVFPVWPIRGGKCSCIGGTNCTSPGKHPMGNLVLNGVRDATTDPENIREWWGTSPDANIGITGLLIVDVDAKGQPDWSKLVEHHGRPETITACTPGGGGGHHHYFKMPTTWQPKNSVGKIAPGIDIRADGGYVVAPPSNHLEGQYTWASGHSPWDVELGEVPPWLANLIQDSQKSITIKQTQAKTYGQAALADAIRQVATTPEGGRNDALFQQTAALVELANGGEVDLKDVETGLLAAGLAAGLPENAVKATIASAIKTAGSKERVAPSANGHRTATPIEKLVAAQDDDVPDLVVQPFSELLAENISPLEFLVDGLIPRGHLVMLAGRPKCGKSWYALQLVEAIDTGKMFLGRATEKGRALYLALEDGKRGLQGRCKLLGWQPQASAAVYKMEKLDYNGTSIGKGIRQLERIAAGYDLVVLDTLVKALSGRVDENSNTAMGEIANALADLAHATGTTILLVHHTSKATYEDVFYGIRGASALRGAYDVGLVIDRKKGEREAMLHLESREMEAAEFTIKQEAGGVRWQMLGSGAELQRIRAGRVVLEYMTAQGDGLTQEELAKAVGITKQAVSLQLNSLEDDGYVMRRAVPGENKGRPLERWYVR